MAKKKKTTATKTKKAASKASGSAKKARPAARAAKKAKTGKKAASKTKSAATPSRPKAVAKKKAATVKPAGKKARKASSKAPKAKAATKAPAKKAAAAPAKKAGGNGQVTKKPKPPKVVKTHLGQADLDLFRDMLMAKRRELVGDVTHLESEALRESGGSGGSSSMPIHMADLGTDAWEQELTLGLIENERGLIREIDEALERIENRTYGICLATHRRISKPRLLAKPWAKYCIAYARKKELGLA